MMLKRARHPTIKMKNPKTSITVKLKKDNKTKEERGKRSNKASKKTIKTSSNKPKNKSSHPIPFRKKDLLLK